MSMSESSSEEDLSRFEAVALEAQNIVRPTSNAHEVSSLPQERDPVSQLHAVVLLNATSAAESFQKP